MQTALISTWTTAFPGREMKALEYGADVLTFWTKQAEEGRCTAPEMFFSGRCGIWLVKGEQDAVRAIYDTDQAQDLMMRGSLLLRDFHVDFYTAGDASDGYLARFARLAEEVL